MDLSIIIISYNTKDLLERCVKSLVKRIKDVHYEIIVVDNSSVDGSVKLIKKFISEYENVHSILNNSNLGFSKGNNQGIKVARGKYILLLNSDTEMKTSILREMIDWLKKNPDIGVASCGLLNTDGSIQGSGGYFPTLARVFSWMTIQDLPFVDKFIKPFHPMKTKSFHKNTDFYKKNIDLDWLTGAFLLIRRDVVDTVGLFDEDYFMYTEEVDYCYRVKKYGYRIVFNPRWNILHHGGASSTTEFSVINEIKGIKIFYKKHLPKWQYPLLRFGLKLGMAGRAILFGLIEGKEAYGIYKKALFYA